MSLLRSLYAEGILSSYLRDTSYYRHLTIYSSPSTLSTHLVNPESVDASLLSPGGRATYFITNSRTPHVARQVGPFTCLWEVSWRGDGVRVHFAFWTAANAPWTAQQYAAVIHILFEVIPQTLGLPCNRGSRAVYGSACGAVGGNVSPGELPNKSRQGSYTPTTHNRWFRSQMVSATRVCGREPMRLHRVQRARACCASSEWVRRPIANGGTLGIGRQRVTGRSLRCPFSSLKGTTRVRSPVASGWELCDMVTRW